MCWCWCILCSGSWTRASEPEPGQRLANTNEMLAGSVTTTMQPNNIFHIKRQNPISPISATRAQVADSMTTIAAAAADKSLSKKETIGKKGTGEDGAGKSSQWSTASSPMELHPVTQTTHHSGSTRRGTVSTGSMTTAMRLMQDKLKSQRQKFRRPFFNDRDITSHWPNEVRQYNAAASRRFNVKDVKEGLGSATPMMIADEQGVRISSTALKAKKKYQQSNLHKNSHHLNKKMLK